MGKAEAEGAGDEGSGTDEDAGSWENIGVGERDALVLEDTGAMTTNWKGSW